MNSRPVLRRPSQQYKLLTCFVHLAIQLLNPILLMPEGLEHSSFKNLDTVWILDSIKVLKISH